MTGERYSADGFTCLRRCATPAPPPRRCAHENRSHWRAPAAEAGVTTIPIAIMPSSPAPSTAAMAAPGREGKTRSLVNAS